MLLKVRILPKFERVFPGQGFWVNFFKKCGDCGDCGEYKYFTAFHLISYKNSQQKSPHFL